MSWIIVGLGNPGEEYAKTHHNAGRMAVEAFTKKFGADEWRFDKNANAEVAKVEISETAGGVPDARRGESDARGVSSIRREQRRGSATKQMGASGGFSATCVLPDTYMNKSGSAVAKYVKSVKAAAKLVVVYDDIDLPLGRIKISFARSSGGHKGVESVMRAIKTDQFVRVRIGIASPNAKGNAKIIHGDEKVLKLILGKFKPAEETELKKVFKHAVGALATIVRDGHVAAMNRFN